MTALLNSDSLFRCTVFDRGRWRRRRAPCRRPATAQCDAKTHDEDACDEEEHRVDAIGKAQVGKNRDKNAGRHNERIERHRTQYTLSLERQDDDNELAAHRLSRLEEFCNLEGISAHHFLMDLRQFSRDDHFGVRCESVHLFQ